MPGMESSGRTLQRNSEFISEFFQRDDRERRIIPRKSCARNRLQTSYYFGAHYGTANNSELAGNFGVPNPLL